VLIVNSYEQYVLRAVSVLAISQRSVTSLPQRR
jgi:hypothetical protein